ncbi:hypothetical protein [Hydrogenophaga sp.]|uniref:hypothetical protein n=1 Tax=Hydrogenophaga sp. TaxID=1904254 RepID=UPI002723BBC1|nr:hypothetical protein [Hydrogenophaga sp.]MDO9438328.1 hypothetical protein [Hydrogenophaga sp.]
MNPVAGLRDPNLPARADGSGPVKAQGATEQASLIDPVPGHPDADARSLLLTHAENPGKHSAVSAIFLLNEGKSIPSTISDTICHTAAQLLLELGQGRLLCRLAQDRPLDYAFNVDAPNETPPVLTVEQKAQVLGKLAASWPQNTPVSLTLSTSFSGKIVQALRPLLLRPYTLSLHLMLQGGSDNAPPPEFSAALRVRTLSALVIHCHSSTPEDLQELDGVQALSVSIQMDKPPVEARLAEFETALVEHVSNSGAKKLNVAHASVRAALAARLLGCRNHWENADLRLEKDVNLLLITNKGRLKIDHLEVHALPAMLSPTTQSLKVLVHAGITTLKVHGALNLGALAKALQTPASTLGGYIQHIEASCMLADGADFEQILVQLSAFRDATSVSHLPAAHAVPGHRPLTAGEATRLTALRSANSSMALAVGVTRPQQDATDQAWLDAIGRIGWLLMPHMTIQELTTYLHSPENKVVPMTNKLPYPGRHSDACSLLGKLKVLDHFGAPHALIRQAIAQLLQNARADMAYVVIDALREMRFPMQKRATAAMWFELARTVQTHWMSDGMHEHRVEVSTVATQKHAEIPLSGPPTTTASTTPPLDPVGLIELISPNTEAGLAQLKRAMRAARPRDLPPNSPVRLAARSIDDLLNDRSIDMSLWTDHARQAFTWFLLEQGQWKLLRHVVPTQTSWHIHASTPLIAGHLAAMAPWPGPESALHLTLHSTLSTQAIQDLTALARTTQSEALSLTIQAHANATASSWDAVAELVQQCPCKTLIIEQDSAAPAPLSTLGAFFKKLAKAQVGELHLIGFRQDSPMLVMDLVTAIQHSGISALRIENGSDTLVEMLATNQPWSRLSIEASPSAAAALREKIIATQTLSLKIVIKPEVARYNSVVYLPASPLDMQDIVGACKGLKVLDLWGTSVDILVLATLLDRSRSITTIQCEPSTNDASTGNKGFDLLRQNTSLQHFLPPSAPSIFTSGSPIERTTYVKIIEQMVRNQFLSVPNIDTTVGEFATGAVRGLASSYGRGMFPGDPSVIIGRMLDWRSAQSLSVVNKATFVGSRQHWESKILRLASGFVPQAPASASPAMNPFLAQIKTLRKTGTPNIILAEALGRRLYQLLPHADAELNTSEVPPTPAPTQEELDTIPHLLEAMEYIGKISPLKWLKEGMGIDPQVPMS